MHSRLHVALLVFIHVKDKTIDQSQQWLTEAMETSIELNDYHFNVSGVNLHDLELIRTHSLSEEIPAKLPIIKRVFRPC